VLHGTGFTDPDADTLARVFADNTRDGVPSHGLLRFPGFVRNVQSGQVVRDARAECAAALGALEQWDGHRGPGILNALACMERAIEIARQHTVGAVALRNTSHWMRAGTYGLQAADAGCVGICWTNTTALMPPHGGRDKRLGNNPLVFGIPRDDGDHVLLDMAISQFSGGRTGIHRKSGEAFPVPGGYDAEGNLTTDAAALERALPIGYWKGSGLALCLDLVAALLSGGKTTAQVARQENEAGVSQLFLAFDLSRTGEAGDLAERVEDALQHMASGETLPGEQVTWPGQRSAAKRRAADAQGIPVDADAWREVQGM
jgi:3-dehydro-L-gulonate 2-dehydrogenase